MRPRVRIGQLPFYLLLGGIILFWPYRSVIAGEACSSIPINEINAISYTPSPGLEEGMLRLVNQHRALKGLPELVLDEKLAEIAREHSTGMAQQGFISHNLPSGDLRSRMSGAGYLHEVVRENVASAPSIGIAQDALAASPGHEGNMLADDVTRVGIGIARCPDPSSRQLYITEIFAAPRMEYGAESVQEVLVSRVHEMREKGAGSMYFDPALEQMASRSLHSISMPYTREELQGALSESTQELGNDEKMELARVQANVQIVHNPSKINIPVYAPEGRARSFGAAIRQVTDSQNQSAFLVLTLIGVAR